MSRPRPALRRAGGVVGALVLGVVLVAAASDEGSAVDPLAALGEGNRLFRDGDVAGAVEAYRAGWSPGSPHPTLLYNLGTALHHLDRLPEAILWYRRAQPNSDDPWLEENLWLARRALGSQSLAPHGPTGWLARHADGMRWLAVAIAWAGLLVLIAIPRTPVWLLAAIGILATGIYGGTVAGERWGPHPAVLIEDCEAPTGPIPAGTEVWVRRADPERWKISAGGPTRIACPSEKIELVFPPR